ncbi:MAG: response regulator transcription factor, partial [Chloroflexota bacterium]
MASRVLIVDDHLAIREGIRSLLAPESDFVVVGEAVDGVDGVQKALALRPDLIVLDNSMPGKTGLEVARELIPLLPDTAIVFLTLDPGIRDLALAVGAAGHISKDTPPQQMLKVLRAAAQQQERGRSGAPELTEKEKALAAALLEAKLVTETQLDTLVAQRKPRELLSSAVLRSKLIPDVPLAQLLSRVSGRPLMTLAPRPEEVVPSAPRPARHAARRTVDPIDPTVARPLLEEAVRDREWAVRVRAAALLREGGAAAGVAEAAIRPAAAGRPIADQEWQALVSPRFSPHAYIETDRGVI